MIIVRKEYLVPNSGVKHFAYASRVIIYIHVWQGLSVGLHGFVLTVVHLYYISITVKCRPVTGPVANRKRQHGVKRMGI